MASILLELNTAQDVIQDYTEFRKVGQGREAAIQRIVESYSYELEDAEAGAQVWIGIAKATGQKHELTTYILDKASAAFDTLLLVDVESMEVVKTYPISLIDTGQCLHPIPRDVWVEDGRLMVEGYEDDPNTDSREIKPGVSFIRSLGKYEIGGTEDIVGQEDG